MTTKQPTNQSELQLYRVLQRANLLQYYDTFITQGGDDVQQLCEAGEEEFLEIMALVGMASKPLHVRRLQKSLQEWVANPGTETPMFQQPLAALTPPPAPPGSIVASVHGAIAGAVSYAAAAAAQHSTPSVITAPTWNPHAVTTMSNSPSPPAANSVTEFAPSPSPSGGGLDTPKNSPSPSNGSGMKRDTSSPTITPVLSESQIQAIADSAEKLAKALPPFLPKPMNTKKQISKEIEDLMSMSPGHPERMDLLRKYAAIYGRFDSKRKNVKPMSLHEISVNEAAAQLCAHVSTLLTRREELFPLARAVVRDSGYQYAKGHSRNKPFPYSRAQGDLQEQQPYKRARLERLLNNSKTIKAELNRIHKEERLAEIHATLAQLTSKQEDLQAQIQEEVEKAEAQAGFTKEDSGPLPSLQVELDALVEHHMLLVGEQNELVQWLTTESRAQGDSQDQHPFKQARIEHLLNNSKNIKAELDKIHKEERLAEIHATLAQLSTKQEELQMRIQDIKKSYVGYSKTSEDNGALQSLQTELDAIVEHHMLLVNEQNDIVQHLARYRAGKKGTQGANSGDDETDSSNLPSGSSSPRNGTADGDDLDFYKMKSKLFADEKGENKGQLQQTLFDEGLRIARQYGMADFAEELKELKEGNDDSNHSQENGNGDDLVDEQAEWNREVDKDVQEGGSPGDVKGDSPGGAGGERNSHVAVESS